MPKYRHICAAKAATSKNGAKKKLRNFLANNDMKLSGGIIDKLRRHYHALSNDELLFNIGDDKITLNDDTINFLQGRNQSRGWRRFLPSFIERPTMRPTPRKAHQTWQTPTGLRTSTAREILVLDEEVLRKCTIEPCCSPIPGDDVLGYITDDGVLQLHKRSCEEAVKLKTRYGNNIIACRWDTHKVLLFDVQLEIRGVDSQGVLYAIADVLHKLTHFIVKRITLDTDDGIFEGRLTISVYDTEDVENVCAQLKQIENVTEAVRV